MTLTRHVTLMQCICLLLCLLATGCAGRNFTRPDPATLQLGSATYEDLRVRLGKPGSEGIHTLHGTPLRTVSYSYAEGARSLVGGTVPARALTLYFHDDILVGHEFTSSFEKDNTDFDSDKALRIEKGRTTKEQILAMLGSPTGQRIHPAVAKEDHRAFVYIYVRSKGRPKALTHLTKVLVVTFDPRGIVTNVDATTSGR